MKHLLLIAGLALPLSFARAENTVSATASATATVADESGAFTGKVIETTNTAGYTYVLVDNGSKQAWAAAPEFPVKLGDSVTIAGGLPMSNYHSKSLNRDFALVYFTGSLTVNDTNAAATPALPPGHPPLPGAMSSPNLDLSGIKKADGGKTIAEIFAGQKKLAGKSVAVRGKVVNYNAGIMGKNWLHIRDGSGGDDTGDNDLTVTTGTAAKLGDTVLVTGKVSLNKDFGAGYKYAVILDDAKVTVE
jgi:hypothetical protein